VDPSGEALPVAFWFWVAVSSFGGGATYYHLTHENRTWQGYMWSGTIWVAGAFTGMGLAAIAKKLLVPAIAMAPAVGPRVSTCQPYAAGGTGRAINISEARLGHVLARHFPGGAQAVGTSVFRAGESVPGLVRAAESVAPVLQQGGRFQRIVEAGRVIGVDRATGLPTSTYTVITDAAENLITTFPGVP
jgi:hypothetical protein